MRHLMLILIISTFILLPEKTISQNLNNGGAGYFSIGTGPVYYSNLDRNLRSTSLPGDVAALSLNIGGGGFGMLKGKIILGGEGHASIFNGISINNIDISRSGGAGVFKLGYNILDENALILFPSIGLGGLGSEIEIRNNNSSSRFFGDAEIPAGESREFEGNLGILDVSVNMLSIIGEAEDNSYAGFVAGVSIGYRTGLGSFNWQTENERQIMGLSSENLTMYYLTIHIGGGGFNLRN